jgi:predicted nucleic acid-binding protein
MTVGIADTTVLIHYFRKLPTAAAWVDSQPTRLTITSITWLEIMEGVQGKAGQIANKTLLARFDIEYLSTADQIWAMQQMERLRLSNGITINDCLIASVSYRLGVPLFTHNLKHMKVMLPAALVVKPY